MKLLNYTYIRHLLFTALLVLISIPIFYVIMNRVFIHAVDNDLYQQAREIPTRHSNIRTNRDLELWRSLDKDLDILPAESLRIRSKPFTVQKMIAGEDEKQDFRILEKPIQVLGRPYIVQIKSSLVEKEDLMQTILLIQLSLFLLVILGAVTINYLINKKVWGPFYHTLHFLKNFDLEKTRIDSPVSSPIQEFSELNSSVHDLAVSVRNAYLSQKEFTENASHELQTPLAVLKSKLELLLQEKDLTRSQSVLIDDMYKVIDRLEILNNSLLFLSKMENNQFFTLNEQFNVKEVAIEVADELHFMMDSKSQELQMNDPLGLTLKGNKSLFKILLTNLLRNAIQHSGPGAVIGLQSSKTCIRVTNPGTPLDLPDEALFNRFTKGGHQKSSGSGLGLAIAKKIAELHHLRIQYGFQGGQHEFRIELDQ